METIATSRLFWGFLLATIVGEFLIPAILARWNPGYSKKIMAMSALGSLPYRGRTLYNLWLIYLGCFFCFCAPVFWHKNHLQAPILSVILLILLIVFGIGAGILAGLFPCGQSKSIESIAAKIHGIGAGIGFLALLTFPLLQSVIEWSQGNLPAGILDTVSFVLAFAFFTLFILSDKEIFQGTPIAYGGLWERLTLASMYLPFVFYAFQEGVA